MQQRKIARLLEAKEMPAVGRTVDLYATEAREVVLMEDAIQVKRQKAQRERRGALLGGASPLTKRCHHRSSSSSFVLRSSG